MIEVIDNPVVQYYDRIQAFAERCAVRHRQSGGPFNPWALPDLDERIRAFFDASSVTFSRVDLEEGLDVILLNMATFQGTLTTKTNPSLLIVARAIEHTRRTNETITIVTPSSGNKATALRAAVQRAYEFELATPTTLNIVCVVPDAAKPKLWNSKLSTNAHWLESNPLATVRTSTRDSVKKLARATAELLTGRFPDRRLWFTLALENYVLADQLRALIEIDYFPTAETRWHAHSVSSAFGLIGHSRGWNEASPEGYPHPGYLLIQHLDTPDMVLHLTEGTFDRSRKPNYQPLPQGGVEQQDSPHFPTRAAVDTECIDTTFYTAAPQTQAEMQGYISTFGGNGIVVSKAECEDYYPTVRESLRTTDASLPSASTALREWSLVMAATGIHQAHRKGLLTGVSSLVLHNSGSYTTLDYEPVPRKALSNVDEDRPDQLAKIIEDASKEMSQA